MKPNIILLLISICLAALLGYLAYAVADPDAHSVLCGIASGVCFAGVLVPLMGMNYDDGRLATNLRTFAGLFFVVFLVCHFCFAAFGVAMPYYPVVSGILLLIFLAVFYKMAGIKEL